MSRRGFQGPVRPPSPGNYQEWQRRRWKGGTPASCRPLGPVAEGLGRSFDPEVCDGYHPYAEHPLAPLDRRQAKPTLRLVQFLGSHDLTCLTVVSCCLLYVLFVGFHSCFSLHVHFYAVF